MKRKRFGSLIALSVALCGALLVPAKAQAAETTRANVDTSKGVTYIEAEGGGYSAINLNGNSVIITPAEKYKGTANANSYRDIYIDKNRNGVIDDGEEKVTLTMKSGSGETTDIPAGMTVYGVYHEKSTTPIRITQLGGSSGMCYGVYDGEISVSSATEPAVYMDFDGGNVGQLYGVYGLSKIDEDGNMSPKASVKNEAGDGVKIDVDIQVGSLNAIYYSEVEATGSAFDFALNSDKSFGSFIGIGGASQIKGNVKAAIDKKSIDNPSLSTATIIYEGSVLEGNIDVDIKNTLMTTAYIVKNGVPVKGNVKCTVKDSKFNGELIAVQESSSISGTYDITVEGTTLNLFHGITSASVGGNYTCLIKDSKGTASIYGASNGATIKGDYVFNVKNTEINQIYAGNKGVNVLGDFTFSMDDKCTYTYSSTSMFGLDEGCYVAGDATLDIYGSQDENKTPSWYACDYNIGGNLTVNFHKGYYNNMYGTDSAAHVGKNYVMNVDGANVEYSLYGFNGYGVSGDATVTLKNTTFGQFYGLQGNSSSSTSSAAVVGKAIVDVDETNSWTAQNYSYMSSNMNIVGNATLIFKAGRALRKGYSSYNYSGLYGINCGSVNGDLKIEFAGVYASQIYGVSAKNQTDYNTKETITDEYKGKVDISVTNCKYTYSNTAYFIINGIYDDDVSITIDGMSIATDYSDIGSSHIYGISGGSIFKGNVDINYNNMNVPGTVYGICTSGKIEGETTVTLSNVKNESKDNWSYFYGISGGTYDKDIKCIMDDVKCSYLYGIANANALANATVKMTNVDVTRTDTAGNLTTSSTYFYGMNSGVCYGNADIEISKFKNAYCYFYGVSGTTLLGDSNITLSDIDLDIDNFYPLYESTSTEGGVDLTNTVKLTMKNVKVKNTVNIQNKPTPIVNVKMSVIGNQKFVCDIDNETVDFGDNYAIYACENPYYLGSIILTYKDCISYGGKAKNTDALVYDKTKGTGYRVVCFSSPVEITKNITAEQIHFGGVSEGAPVIGKGVTVSSTDDGYVRTSGAVILEGELKGKVFTDYINSTTNVANAYGCYMYNGGSFTYSNSDCAVYKYFPVEVNWDDKHSDLTKYGWSVKPVMRPDVYFHSSGTLYEYNITCDTGYYLADVNLKYEGDAAAESLQVTGASSTKTFSFTMREEAGVLNIDVKPKQIAVIKTVGDPVTKLGTNYTEEDPLYDLSTLKIYNDATEGEMIFEVDKTNTLPEGLVFNNNKIYGKTTKAYESGKMTRIKITGKNGSSVYLNLNIVVTAGNATQTNSDGRVYDDVDNSMINLCGNSVVLEEVEQDGAKLTAIYIDEDRDGVKDYETPTLVKDLSSYDIVGVKDEEKVTKPISITMNGGKVRYIYGAYNSVFSLDGTEDALSIVLKGGSVSYVYFRYGYNIITDGIYYESALGNYYLVATGVYRNYTAKDGFCYVNTYSGKRNAYFGYSYTLKKDMNVDYISLNGSDVKVIIPKGMKLTTNTSEMYSAYIYNYGTFEATSNIGGSNGIILKFEGSEIIGEVTDKYSMNFVYYPLDLNLYSSRADVIGLTNAAKVTENGETKYFAKADSTDTITVTNLSGYEFWSNLNNTEDVQSSSNAISFAMPRQAAKLDIYFISSEISLEKRFADPVGVVGKKYETSSALYDYTRVKVINDSNDVDERTYTLKKGSSLPKGLRLENGLVVGTPTEEVKDLKVTVTIKGHNGNTADIDVYYNIQADALSTEAYDRIEKIGDNIYLNGTSIVMITPEDYLSNFSIYVDMDHDGIADDNVPFKDEDGNTIFSSVNVYGYSDTKTPYDGDITIYNYGGGVRDLFGVYGNGSNKAVVNGDVSIYELSGDATREIAAAKYGSVKNATVEIGGDNNRVAYLSPTTSAVSNSEVSGNVNLKIEGKTQWYGSNCDVYVANNSTIGGNTNMYYNTYSTDYGFNHNSSSSSRYSSYYYDFYGVSNCIVEGNANYIVDGYFVIDDTLYYSYRSTIKGTLDIDVKSGTIRCVSGYAAYRALVREGNVNAVKFNMAENSSNSIGTYGSPIYVVYNGEVGTIDTNIPTGAGYSYLQKTYVSYDTEYGTVTKGGAMRYRGAMTAFGEYTFAEDDTATSATFEADSKITVPEDVTFTVNGNLTNNGTLKNCGTTSINGVIYNYKTIDNYGEFNTYKTTYTGNYLLNYADALIINRENATFNLGCKMSNSGKIVNYGDFKQTYTRSGSYNLGNVYVVKELDLTWGNDKSYYTTSGNKIYRPITLDYTDYCATVSLVDSNLDPIASSGVEGDETQYVAYGETFYVKIDDVQNDLGVAAVNYTCNGDVKSASKDSDSGDSLVYFGVAGQTDTVVSVEFGKDDTDPITISPTTGSVAEITVGQNKNWYNVANIVSVSNDTDVADAYVTYTVATGSKLPSGLTINRKTGVISGAPKIATDEPQSTTINVVGKNQTVAQFTLKFEKVNKGSLNLNANYLFGYVGNKLSTVTLPKSTYGSYSWANANDSLGEASGDFKFKATFTPYDEYANNYDWSSTDGATYNESTKKVELELSVHVYAIAPTYTVPTNIEASYKQKLEDIDLSEYEDENGVFAWDETYNKTDNVGDLGEKTFYLKYVPKDSSKYNVVNRIAVKVTVVKAKKIYENKVEALYGWVGDTLADIELPTSENGKYKWISVGTTVAQDGATYKIGFVPNDTAYYDYSDTENWSKAYSAVIITVPVYLYEEGTSPDYTVTGLPVKLTADHGTKLSDIILPNRIFNDENKLVWRLGNTPVNNPISCGDGIPTGEFVWEDDTLVINTSGTFTAKVKYVPNGDHYNDVEAISVTITVAGDHVWDAGTVKTAATETSEGEMLYTCTKCGATKTEPIPVVEPSENPGDKPGEDEGVPAKVGTALTDETVKATFAVISNDAKNPEVEYVGTTNKAATALTVPETVTVKGVKYKVTSIKKNAFKGNKTLTSVKIPKTVKTIGASAFENCKKLKTVTFAKKSELKKIGAKAFSKCPALTKVTITSTKLTTKTVGKQVFTKSGSKNYKKLVIKVPKKQLKAYKKFLYKKGLNKKAKVKK